jgi:uncharacterized protein YlxW (UPF0749 family)
MTERDDLAAAMERANVTGMLPAQADADRALLAAEVKRLTAQVAEEQDRVQRLRRALRGVFTDKMRLEAAIQEAVGDGIVAALTRADTPAERDEE